MPQNTPIYGFTYPCPGDPINATSFSTLANQIDTQLAALDADEDWAVGRYVTVQRMVPNQAGVVSGVDTVLVNPGSTFVIPAAGVWTVSGDAFISPVTSIDAGRLRFRLNGVPFFGHTQDQGAALINGSTVHVPGVSFVANAGDTVSATVLFFGVGAATVAFSFGINMVVRIQ